MTRRSIALFLLVAFGLACGNTEKPKRETEEEETEESPKKKKKKKKKKGADDEGSAAASSKPVAPPPPTATAGPKPPPSAEDPAGPPALAVGQWVRYVKTDPERSTVEYRVVRMDPDGAVTFEVDAESVGSKSTTELVLELKDRTKLDGIVIRQVRTKTATGIVTIPESGVRVGMAWVLKDLLLPSFEGSRREDVKVQAGAFSGCVVSAFEDSIIAGNLKATRYLHPSVPINGFVLYEGTVSRSPTRKELVAFGLTGAKAKF